MTVRKILGHLVLLLIVLALSAGAGFLWKRTWMAPTPLTTGDTLPNGVVHLHNGAAVRIAELANNEHLTGLIVFSPTCGSCGAQAPSWEKIGLEFSDAVVLKGIAVTQEEDFLNRFIRNSSISFEVGRTDDPSLPI